MMAALALVEPFFGAAAKQTNDSSIYLIFIVIGAGFYFLIYRPQQRKAKALRSQSNAFEVGDEVLTAGGIVGHVIDIDGDRVTLETSVGASFVVLKQYVLRKLEDPTAPEEDGGMMYGDDDPEDVDEDDEPSAVSDDPAEDEHEGGDDAGESHSDETPSGQEHPAGQGGTTGTSTKADGGDDGGGPDGPPII
jgi:preprotein translocase subunit YajC